LVRGQVPAARFDENERAVVEHEVALEEAFWSSESVLGPAPEARAAHLAARAGEAQDGAFRVLSRRASDLTLYPHPISDHLHVAERDARLRHPEWPGVHTDEEHALRPLSPRLQVGLVRLSGVVERIVQVGHRRRETKARHVG